jgi:hypothetical protein
VLFRWRKVWRSLKIIIFVKIKICGEFYLLNFWSHDIQHKDTQHNGRSLLSAECHYGECDVLLIIMLNVIMLSVAVLSLIMLIVVKNGWMEHSALEKTSRHYNIVAFAL